MASAKMTTRGRITIPKEVREKLKLKAGSQISFWIESSGRVVLQPLKSDFRAFAGTVKSPNKRPISVEEMNEAISAAVAEEYIRSVRRS
jgi:AbrB family looped-hinge helix DNA binding protein